MPFGYYIARLSITYIFISWLRIAVGQLKTPWTPCPLSLQKNFEFTRLVVPLPITLFHSTHRGEFCLTTGHLRLVPIWQIYKSDPWRSLLHCLWVQNGMEASKFAVFIWLWSPFKAKLVQSQMHFSRPGQEGNGTLTWIEYVDFSHHTPYVRRTYIHWVLHLRTARAF